MSADVLRQAAALMRERAEGATPGPWVVDEFRDDATNQAVDIRARRGAGPTVAATIPLGYEQRRINATHIASWHPAVALAVADWLWVESFRHDAAKHADCTDATHCPHAAALRVARAYLGESA